MARGKQKNKKSPVQVILTILIIVCIGVFGFSGYKLATELIEYKKGDEAYEEIVNNYALPVNEIESIIASGEEYAQFWTSPQESFSNDEQQGKSQTETTDDRTIENQKPGEETATGEKKVDPFTGLILEPDTSKTKQPIITYQSPINFQTLKKDHPNVVGWIYLSNTVVNYPIVQGEDNTTYLRRTADEQYNKAGAIYMDYES
ncbi:MAG: class B sortase, partial [Clostridiales bacterium]|nr:class B sortase [Clostridiales bacterium]